MASVSAMANVGRLMTIGGILFFSQGNHGSNAWACVPLKVGGFADWAVVGIWESNPAITPAQAMHLVAYARR